MRPYFHINAGGEGYYGRHFIGTFRGLNENLLDVDLVATFLSSLADRIGMERFGPAHVYRFGEGEDLGLSGFQLITTSAISLHTNDEWRDLYLDVFSCKAFDTDEVLAFVEESFGRASESNHQVLMRR